MLKINNLEEMKPYYNENTNTYEFIENGVPIDVHFTFSIDIKPNIKAGDINAENIIARNIESGNINAGDIISGNIIAWDIDAGDIKAWNIVAERINARNIDAGDIKAGDIISGDISFYAICSAQSTLKCKSIKGRRKNAKYFCLDNEVEFIKQDIKIGEKR